MAVATTTVTKTQEMVMGKLYVVYGTIAVSANPDTYAAGGLNLNLALAKAKTNRVPLSVTLTGKSGYVYEYVNGTSASNGKMKVRFCADSNPLVEIPSAAIPAAVSNDVISYKVEFLGQL